MNIYRQMDERQVKIKLFSLKKVFLIHEIHRIDNTFTKVSISVKLQAETSSRLKPATLLKRGSGTGVLL